MNPSPLTIGIAMIGFALIAPAMALRAQDAPLSLLSCFAAAPLLLGGVAMFVRRRESFLVAMGAAGLVVVCGVAGLLVKRQVGLPISPAISLTIGLYAGFRVAMARPSLVPATARRSVADHLARTLTDEADEPATRPFVRSAKGPAAPPDRPPEDPAA